MRDPLESVRKQWGACRPDLDTSPMEVAGRILFASEQLFARLGPVFQRHRLTWAAFDVLATLRRSGSPFVMTPGGLQEALFVSSGTLTHRLDRLEEHGFIERKMDRSDRRSWEVGLTEAGLETTDQLMAEHLKNEKRLFESLSEEEQILLARLLSKWIQSLKSL